MIAGRLPSDTTRQARCAKMVKNAEGAMEPWESLAIVLDGLKHRDNS